MPSGSCLCGKATYEYTGEPAMIAVCHCLTCRKLTGSTNTYNHAIPSPDFHLAPGVNLKSYVTKHETGMAITLFFCGDCGNTIYKQGDSDMFKGLVLVQAGTLDTPKQQELELPKPGAELFVKYRLPWLPGVEAVGQKAEF